MATMNTAIGPERVQVFPEPLGVLPIAGAGISTAAFLISTAKSGAPEQVATAVQTLDQFVELFGDADDTDGYYYVKGFYDNAGEGSTCYIVNVGASPTALDYIGDSAASTGLFALDSLDILGLICAPGLPLAQAYLVQKSLIDYTETVRTEFGATLSTSFSLLAIPQEIQTASIDEEMLVAQHISTSGSGPWTIALQIEDTAVAATGTVTITDFADLISGTADTIAVAGVVFTAQAGAATLGQPVFQAATDNDATAASLAAQINAHATAGALVTAVATGPAVLITADIEGTVGNSYTLVYTDNDTNIGATVTGAGTLTGGSNGNADLSEVTPGMIVKNQAGTYIGVISAVDNTDDELVVTPNPSTFFNSGDNVIIAMPSAVTYKESVINNPARTAAWFYNNVILLDRDSSAEPGDLVIKDPIGHVAGVVARIDSNTSIGGPSHAPAGIQYGQLAGVQGLALQISERLDAAPLRLAFINRITSFAGTGPIVFGGYTADSETPAFTADDQLIQVIRTVQFIKASLEPGLRPFIWENYSPETQDQVKQAIESFLRNNSYLFPKGLPESEQFKVQSITPTVDQFNQGLLIVTVQIKPNKAVRFIQVNLQYPLT